MVNLDKSGQLKNSTLVIIGLVILVLAAQGGLNLGGIFSTTPTGTDVEGSGDDGTITSEDIACAGIDKATGTLGPVKDKFAPGNAVCGTHTLFVNGLDQGEKNDASTFSFGPRDDVTIYYCGTNMTDAVDEAGTSAYYTNEHSFVAPCSSFSTGDAVLDPERRHLIMQHDASLTINLFDSSDDDDENEGSGGTADENNVVGDGGTLQEEIKFVGNGDTVLAPWGDMVMVFDFDSGVWDSNSVLFSGWESTVVPENHNAPFVNSTSKAFKLAGSQQEARIESWVFQLKATNDPPGSDVADSGGNVNMTLFFEDWGQDTNDDIVRFGIEDSNDNLQGPTPIRTYIGVE